MTTLSEIADIESEIYQLDQEIFRLSSKRKRLQEKKNEIIRNAKEMRRVLEESLEPDWKSSEFKWSTKLSTVANTMFNFSHIRPGQLEIMNATISRYDVLAVMKTGGGKSLCYQLPALAVDDGFTLVVSPLVALIRDQLRGVNKVAPNAARSLVGNMERSDQNEVYRAMDTCGSAPYDSGHLRLLYVTPEKVVKSKLLMTHLQRAYDRGALSRFVIDEAHCASQWCVYKLMLYDSPLVSVAISIVR
jgi:ATP-dependent DNA helicase Q1